MSLAMGVLAVFGVVGAYLMGVLASAGPAAATHDLAALSAVAALLGVGALIGKTFL